MSSSSSPSEPSERSETDTDAADHSALSPEVLEQLYAECGPGLRRFLFGLLGSEADVADCLQDCFAIAAEAGGRCRPAARRAWLYVVARNQAARLIRRRQLHRRATGDLAVREETAGEYIVSDVVGLALSTERHREVQQAIERLPEDQRTIVRMRIHEDRTFREIALALNIPLGTALSRMRAALKRLAEELERS